MHAGEYYHSGNIVIIPWYAVEKIKTQRDRASCLRSQLKRGEAGVEPGNWC